MNKNLLPIAKEGFKPLLVSLSFTLLFLIFDLDFFLALSLLFLLILLFLFRNPERHLVPSKELRLLSPADGVVRNIEELDDAEYGYRVEIESRYSDVALLRVPADLVLNSMSKRNGTRLPVSSRLHSDLNEKMELVFSDASEKKVKLVHILKRSCAPINCDMVVGQKLHQGERYGYMLNGLTTFYLPKDVRLHLAVGDELKASESLLAYFS